MRFIQYVDLADHEGNLVNTVMVPVEIGRGDITNVTPYFSAKGKLFKNVSLLTNSSGHNIKVVGNYNEITNNIKNRAIKIKGFKR